jgi:hypothetical protein
MLTGHQRSSLFLICQIHNTLFFRKLPTVTISLSVYFRPRLMFVGKVRILNYSAVPERHFTQVDSGLSSKYYTRLEKSARNKNSSLLRPFMALRLTTLFTMTILITRDKGDINYNDITYKLIQATLHTCFYLLL